MKLTNTMIAAAVGGILMGATACGGGFPRRQRAPRPTAPAEAPAVEPPAAEARRRRSTPARPRTTARARAAARPTSTPARLRTTARARAAARADGALTRDLGRPGMGNRFGLPDPRSGARPSHRALRGDRRLPPRDRLVRDPQRELHADGRAAAALRRCRGGAVPGGHARRVDVDRVDRSARPRLPRGATSAARPREGALGLGPPVLDGRRGQEHARSASHAVHRGGASARGRASASRCRTSSARRSRSRTRRRTSNSRAVQVGRARRCASGSSSRASPRRPTARCCST